MKMNVTIKQIEGLAMTGYGGTRHWVAMDAPENLGGAGAGSRPMELMLMGIAGCSAMDIVAILHKKKVALHSFEVSAEADRADEHPQVFTKIVFNYIFTCQNLKAKDFDRAIELTDEKYCGAIAMVRAGCEIIHQYEIHEV